MESAENSEHPEGGLSYRNPDILPDPSLFPRHDELSTPLGRVRIAPAGLDGHQFSVTLGYFPMEERSFVSGPEVKKSGEKER